MNHMPKESSAEQPLRLVLPVCYQHLIDQFNLYHLHPYDVKASGIPDNGGFTIVLRYGDGLTQWNKQFFAYGDLENMSAESELTLFFMETAQICKKAMIADYYKMMKP